jgi:hypothetical protein
VSNQIDAAGRRFGFKKLKGGTLDPRFWKAA